NANLSKACVVCADFWRAKFTNKAKLIDILAYNADFIEAVLTEADLTGADADSSDFAGANFTDANVSGAHISGAFLEKAICLRSKITPEQFCTCLSLKDAVLDENVEKEVAEELNSRIKLGSDVIHSKALLQSLQSSKARNYLQPPDN